MYSGSEWSRMRICWRSCVGKAGLVCCIRRKNSLSLRHTVVINNMPTGHSVLRHKTPQKTNNDIPKQSRKDGRYRDSVRCDRNVGKLLCPEWKYDVRNHRTNGTVIKLHIASYSNDATGIYPSSSSCRKSSIVINYSQDVGMKNGGWNEEF